MSSPDQPIANNLDASAVTRRAADWVSAQRSPKDWSDARQADLDAWLAESLAHRVAYLRVDAAWQRAQRLAALRTPMRQPPESERNFSGLGGRVAVAAVFMAVAGFAATQFWERSDYQLIETPKGGQERVTLSDGSQLELNTNTAVKVSFRGDRRYVELTRGEAYFEVRHDAARPFMVAVGNRRIIDLGTKFVVRMAPSELKVSLLEGKARFESSETINPQKPVILSPGDVVVATSKATQVFKETRRELSETLAWRRGSVVFHYKRLDDAVAELNRYGGPALVVADANTAKLLISGTFLTNRPEDFAGLAHEIFGLRVQRRNGALILSR